ncbi:MAG: glycoside hydrolase family 88 protein [Reichenbachiella sp.]
MHDFFTHTLKLKRISLLYWLSIVLLLVSAADAQLPYKKVILDQMRRVNDYWIADNTDFGTNNWDRAVYYHGNNRLFSVYPDSAYYQYSLDWADLYNWQVYDNPNSRFADDHACGTAYIELHLIEPSNEKITPITENIFTMVHSSERDDWWWIDAFYMAMPVFTKLGVLHNDSNYFQSMYELFDDTKTRRGLYNAHDGLWYRDENYLPPYSEPNGEDTYWSRGNGWVFAALARVLDELPESDPHRQEYLDIYNAMAVALKAVQRDDGLWNPSLHDPDNYGGPESSGTSFFTFGIAWGINNDILDSAEYIDVVINGWNGLNGIAVHPDGKLGYCQHIGKDPQPAYYEDTKDYAVGSFILAGAEVLQLAPGEDLAVLLNRAKGATVTASDFQSENPATAINDGNLVTRWSAETYPQWIELDLDTVAAIEAIELVFYKNRSYTFVVEGKKTIDEPYEELGSADGTIGGMQMVSITDATPRYIRVTVTGGGDHYDGTWVSINEIRVFLAAEEELSSFLQASSSSKSSEDEVSSGAHESSTPKSSEGYVSSQTEITSSGGTTSSESVSESTSSEGLRGASSSIAIDVFSSEIGSVELTQSSSANQNLTPLAALAATSSLRNYGIVNTFDPHSMVFDLADTRGTLIYSISGKLLAEGFGAQLKSILEGLPKGLYVLKR